MTGGGDPQKKLEAAGKEKKKKEKRKEKKEYSFQNSTCASWVVKTHRMPCLCEVSFHSANEPYGS